MIEGYIGKPGSGKSFALTAAVLEHADRGRNVFVNYPISYPNVYLYGPGDLLDLPPGLIVIDEAHLYFPARQALNLPPSWLALMSQTRKRGWDLLWAAQHENRVDRVLRDVTSWLWLCRATWKWNGHPSVFSQSCWEPEYFRNPKKKMYTRFRYWSRRVAAAYNTMGDLQMADHAIGKGDMYAAKAKTERGRRYSGDAGQLVVSAEPSSNGGG